MTEPAAEDLVDAHVHLWDPEHLDYAWLAGSALRRRFDADDFRSAARSVTEVVAVQADCRADQSGAEVRWLADRFGDGPSLLGVVAHAPVERGRELHRILPELLGAGPVVGIRRLIQDEPAGFTRRGYFDAGLAIVGEYGLPFDLCVRAHQLAEIGDLVERHPGLTFVLDHLGKPPVGDAASWPAWQADLTRLAQYPGLLVKLSGLFTELRPGTPPAAVRPYLQFAVDTFGPGRCLFGSDWPVVTSAGSHDQWRELVADVLSPLRSAERAAILSANARRIYTRALVPSPEETPS